MALPLLVLSSGFCSGGGTESLDIAVTEDGKGESRRWSGSAGKASQKT